MKKVLIFTLLLLVSPMLYASSSKEKPSNKEHEQTKPISTIFDSTNESNQDTFETANRNSDDDESKLNHDSNLNTQDIQTKPQSVPENQTYKLMALGLVMMGFTMWRRKSS